MIDMKEAIKRASEGIDLKENETREVFGLIMSGKATHAQIAAFITAMRIKGETVGEITGAARVMRSRALKVRIKGGSSRVLDTCGTGGSGSGTFNVSTAVAFVLAGCGVKVAKHGNRAVSGQCGSADVLEKLGVRITAPVEVMERAINDMNVGFLFAPLFHGAMKHAAPVRKEIGIRTIFNILGPLSSPASAGIQVMGVYDGALTVAMAKVLRNLGSERAFVVHGDGPVDEVSICGNTRISELRRGRVRTYNVSPADFGVKERDIRSVRGRGAEENAAILRDVLSGRKGPRRDIVLMNSSVAIVAASKAKNFIEGMKTAARVIDSGEALNRLEMLIRITGEDPR